MNASKFISNGELGDVKYSGKSKSELEEFKESKLSSRGREDPDNTTTRSQVFSSFSPLGTSIVSLGFRTACEENIPIAVKNPHAFLSIKLNGV